MELLSIGVKESKDEIRDIVDNYQFSNEIKIEEEQMGNRLFIKFISKDDKNLKKDISCYDILSWIITEIIVEFYLKEMVMKKVFMKYNDFKRDEKVEIIQLSYEILNSENAFKDERQQIFDEVYRYITANNEIIIDGFVNFRLKGIDNLLDNLIDKSIEKFAAEKEYKEFIKILQYFIDIQEPKMDLVNVVVQDDNYKLYDKNNLPIENDFFSEVINELANEGISKDDLLISSLITIAPQKIIIHGDKECKNSDIVTILENVFMEKVIFCTGCELCTIKLPINKE